MIKYSCYYYDVFQTEGIIANEKWNGWIYELYDGAELIRESEEWFDTEKEAIEASIDHIDALENGER